MTELSREQRLYGSLNGTQAAPPPDPQQLRAQSLEDRLYPLESRAEHYRGPDLDKFHLAEGRDAHAWDEAGLRREAAAARLAPVDFALLVNRAASGESLQADDRQQVMTAVEARRAMEKQHGPGWERDFKAADAWFKRTAPRLHRQLNAGIAGNDTEVLNAVLGAYRRSRA